MSTRGTWKRAGIALALLAAASVALVQLAVQRPSAAAPPEGAELHLVRVTFGPQPRVEHEAPNGLRESVLRVPAGEPVRLLVHARGGAGVLRIPELGVRVAVSPERPAETWLTAPRGTFPVLVGARWVTHLYGSTQAELSPSTSCFSGPPSGMTEVEWGAHIFVSNGCPSCHRPRDSANGPPLGQLGLTRRPPDLAPRRATPEELAAVIREPERFRTGAYEVHMPRFAMPQSQIDALVAYVSSLAPADEAGP